MKKLKKISLENFDRLSSSEASRLIGGYTNPTIPPPKNTTNTPKTGDTQPVSVVVTPSGGSGSVNVGNVTGTISGGSGGISGGGITYRF